MLYVTSAGYDSGTTTQNYDYTGLTVTADANSALFINLSQNYNGDDHSGTATWDYGGTNQSFTITKYHFNSGGENGWFYFGYVLNPTAGNKTLRTSFDSSAMKHLVAVVQYKNVQQTGQFDSQGTLAQHDRNSHLLTASTTVVSSSAWLVGAFMQNNGNCTAGTGTTKRVGDPSGFVTICDSNAVVGTGSQSLIVDCTSNNWQSGDVWSVIALSNPVGPVNVKSVNGITASTGIKSMNSVTWSSVKSLDGIA